MTVALLFGLLAFLTIAELLICALYLVDTQESPLTERLEEPRLHAMTGATRAERRRSGSGS